jgi:6-phosphogluconate dehydrogenase (decarboxylating)
MKTPPKCFATDMNHKPTLQLGMIGLGRMGANMARRLIKDGHRCVVFDRSPEVTTSAARKNSRQKEFIM